MVFFIFIHILKETCVSNSGEPDQTPHFVVSDLVLHYLPLSHKKDSRLLYGLSNPTIHTANNKGAVWPEVIKLFSCSTQMSTEFQLLIKTKILTNEEVSCFKSFRCIYHADKC